MCHVCLLGAQRHRADEALKLRGLAREGLANKRVFGDDTLPGLAATLACRQHLHDLIFAHGAHFRQRNIPFALK